MIAKIRLCHALGVSEINKLINEGRSVLSKAVAQECSYPSQRPNHDFPVCSPQNKCGINSANHDHPRRAQTKNAVLGRDVLHSPPLHHQSIGADRSRVPNRLTDNLLLLLPNPLLCTRRTLPSINCARWVCVTCCNVISPGKRPHSSKHCLSLPLVGWQHCPRSEDQEVGYNSRV